MNSRHSNPKPQHHVQVESPDLMIVCIFLASLILGLLPITINPHLASTPTQDIAPVPPTEAGLWSAVGR